MDTKVMIEQLEAQREKISVAINSLRALTPHPGRPLKLNGALHVPVIEREPIILRHPRKKRKLSKEGRERIVKAVKKYWAKRRKEEAKKAA